MQKGSDEQTVAAAFRGEGDDLDLLHHDNNHDQED